MADELNFPIEELQRVLGPMTPVKQDEPSQAGLEAAKKSLLEIMHKYNIPAVQYEPLIDNLINATQRLMEEELY